MPFNVVFVHGITGIVGQAVNLELPQGRMVSGFQLLHFALGSLQSFLQRQAVKSSTDIEDLRAIFRRKGVEGALHDFRREHTRTHHKTDSLNCWGFPISSIMIAPESGEIK